MLRMGIDLGGTKIEGIVLDAEGSILWRQRIPTEQDQGYRHVLGRIQSLRDELSSRIIGEPYVLGIGTPGAISKRTSLVKNSSTLCLNGRPLRKDLEQLLGRKIEVQNDANCFALAEALHGVGKGYKLVFGAILGTGCGGGIVYKGALISGPQSIAGEWGHTSIDPNGPLCFCGHRGCVETYISGSGVTARHAEQYGEVRSFAELAEDYHRQEVRAVATMTAFFADFGRATANLINVLDPDVVILGGGLSNFEPIYSRGVTEVSQRVFSDSFETPIVKHSLGDSAGVIGAALIGV
jgi:fructokinase